jgi:hypothetical protein
MCITPCVCARATEKGWANYAVMHKYYYNNFSVNKQNCDAQTHERGRSAVYIKIIFSVFSYKLTVTSYVYMTEICFHAGLQIKRTRQRWAVTSKEATCRWVGHPSELLSEEKCIDPACSRDQLGPGDQRNSLMKCKMPTLSEQISYQTNCIL